MPSFRTTARLLGTALLAALIVSGCSGSDDASDQPAAAQQQLTPGFQVASPNFQESAYPRVRIPKKNSCYGENVSPPFDWSGAPSGTRRLAFIAEDIDHQAGTWALWVLYNIPTDVTELAEGFPPARPCCTTAQFKGPTTTDNPGITSPAHHQIFLRLTSETQAWPAARPLLTRTISGFMPSTPSWTWPRGYQGRAGERHGGAHTGPGRNGGQAHDQGCGAGNPGNEGIPNAQPRTVSYVDPLKVPVSGCRLSYFTSQYVTLHT